MISARFCARLVTAFMLVLPVCAVAQNATSTVQQQEQDTFNDIVGNLRCLTCPNETIAESASPMAMDVKLYVAQHLAMGESKDIIIDKLTERYGEALRYKPKLAAHTWLLWLTPLIALVFGGACIVVMMRRKQRSPHRQTAHRKIVP